ncbi:MAG: single-stranded DNA-binding protein [Bacteroidetes bacterium]|jgi:single-strand DNA-binding protein|nr:single-stranded DNA-binding protein [Bacteroidota bacterium]
MNTVNRVQLTGNLGKKPEIKSFENGNKVAKFSVATNEEYTTKTGEKATDTQWHNVAVWGKLVEVVESGLDKGTFVSVEGRLSTTQYTDKSGVKKYFTEIVATEVIVKEKAGS